MTELNYFRLINRAVGLYCDGRAEEAYDLIAEHGDRVGGNPAQIFNFRFCIANALGKGDLALDLMREAIEDRGYWYSHDYLFDDDDLGSLWDEPEFKRLAEICREREAGAKERTRPELSVLLPHGGVEGVIVALHGDSENATIIQELWSSCLDRGYVLALPQSSQVTYWEAYEWADLERGRDEMDAHLSTLEEGFGRERDTMILAGFSGGARMLMHSILQGDVSPEEVILVGPWLPELEEWEEGIRSLDGIRFSIICGDGDEDCYGHAVRLNEVLMEADIPVAFEVVKGLDHDFPVDFEGRLARILDRIEGR